MEKYPIELNDHECALILENSVVTGQLKATLVRMSNKKGNHTIQMSLFEISDLVGWMAAEANHATDPQEAEELGELHEYFENIEFRIKSRQ